MAVFEDLSAAILGRTARKLVRCGAISREEKVQLLAEMIENPDVGSSSVMLRSFCQDSILAKAHRMLLSASAW